MRFSTRQVEPGPVRLELWLTPEEAMALRLALDASAIKDETCREFDRALATVVVCYGLRDDTQASRSGR